MGEAIDRSMDRVAMLKTLYTQQAIPRTLPWMFLITDGIPNMIGNEQRNGSIETVNLEKWLSSRWVCRGKHVLFESFYMQAKNVKSIFRLLVIEDDPERVELFRRWTSKDIHIVWARSAGTALGLIRRDPGHVYGGIMLDHDLQQQAMTEDDLTLSGTDVARLIVQCISHDIPILVHSTNQTQAIGVVKQLEHSGFWVEHIPMYNLTKSQFQQWMEDAIDLWLMRN